MATVRDKLFNANLPMEYWRRVFRRANSLVTPRRCRTAIIDFRFGMCRTLDPIAEQKCIRRTFRCH